MSVRIVLFLLILSQFTHAQDYKSSNHWKNYQQSVPFQQTYEVDSAVYYLDQALMHAQMDSSWNMYLWYANEKSRFLFIQEASEEALTVLKKAQSVYKLQNDSALNFNYGYTFGGIGFIHYSRGENEQAIVHYDCMSQHLERLRAINPNYYQKNKALVDHHLAKNYMTLLVVHQTQYEKTLQPEHLKKAVESARLAWDYCTHESVQTVLPELISKYGLLFAMLYPIEAVEFLEDTRDWINPKDRHLLYEHLASYYQAIEQPKEAIQQLHKANALLAEEDKEDTREIITTGGQSLATNAHFMAQLYAQIGRTDSAKMILEQSLLTTTDSFDRADGYNALTYVHMTEDQLSEAERCIDQAIAYTDRVSDRATYMDYLLRKADIHLYQEAYEASRSLLKDILSQYEQIGLVKNLQLNSLNQDLSLGNVFKLANLYARLFLAEGRSEDHQKSMELYTLGFQMANSLSATLYDKQSLAYVSNRIKKAIPNVYEIQLKQYEQTKDPTFLASLIDMQSNNKARIIRTHLHSDHPTVLPQTDTMGLYINRLKTDVLNSANDSVRKQLQQRKIHAMIEDFHQRFDADYLQGGYSPVYLTGIGDQIRAHMDTNDYVIDYYVDDSVLYAIGISKDGYQWHKCSLPNGFQRSCQALYRSIKSGNAHPDVAAISRILMEPFKQELAKRTHVSILPDHYLYNIPFECLTLDDQALIERVSVSYHYAPSLYLASKQSTRSEVDHIVLAAPSFEDKKTPLTNTLALLQSVEPDASVFRNDRLVELPFAMEEVNEIGALFAQHQVKHTVLTAEAASKERVLLEAPNSSILHIATHGISLQEQPLRSSLFFSNNHTLIMNELFDLELNVDLVVLSACKSASGQIIDGEGVLALPNGFIGAGAHNVLASLWKVHDEKTKILMTSFYRHLLSEKNSYAEALRLAKLECIQKGFLPMDWLGFVLIGQ